MANSIVLLLLASGAAVLGFAIAYQWKYRKIKQLSTTLDQLKSSFSTLERDQNQLLVFLDMIQKEKEKLATSNLKNREIIQSLHLNIQQLESDRQSIINAFNTYKTQTVGRIKEELDQTKDTNAELKEKYLELLEHQEEKFAMVIDLTRRREVKTAQK